MSKTGRITKKRKLTGSNKVGNPPKKAMLAKATKVPSKTKGTQSLKCNDGKSNKKQSDSCVITGASNISRDRNRTWPFMFNCVDEEWQHNACAIMGLEFVAGNGLNHCGPHVILKRPHTVKSILGSVS